MRKFQRTAGRRRLFKKSLMTSLVMHEKIATTEARAKELRPMVEKLVTIGKGQKLSDFRLLLARLPKRAAEKVFYQIAPKYKERPGGYLRIIKTPTTRKRDGVRVARIEFV